MRKANKISTNNWNMAYILTNEYRINRCVLSHIEKERNFSQGIVAKIPYLDCIFSSFVILYSLPPNGKLINVFCTSWDYNMYLICVHDVQDWTIHSSPPHTYTHKIEISIIKNFQFRH